MEDGSSTKDIGMVLERLAKTIHDRRDASPDESYTARLLQGDPDKLLKKIGEESTEVVMAAKDASHEHILYESADLVYHLLVVFERYGVTVSELAEELDARTVLRNGARTAQGEALHGKD